MNSLLIWFLLEIYNTKLQVKLSNIKKKYFALSFYS